MGSDIAFWTCERSTGEVVAIDAQEEIGWREPLRVVRVLVLGRNGSGMRLYRQCHIFNDTCDVDR